MPLDSPRQWTPRRINAALRCPKPTGEVARFYQSLSAPTPRSAGRPALVERLAAFIAQHADFLQVPSDNAFEQRWQLTGKPCGWLLVPCTTWVVDALATLDAEHDDLEPDNDTEPCSDHEPDQDGETGADEERSDVRPRSISRGGFPDDGPDLVIAAEQRRRYREGDYFSRTGEMRKVKRALQVLAR